MRFIADWLSGDYGKRELCACYGVSRPTGDKWIRRFECDGVDGLKARSRAPHRHPNALDEASCAMIIEAKLAHQRWGPKKVVDWLRRAHPERCWPADSTVGEILKRAGLVRPRRYRRRVAADPQPFGACQRANQIWSADFKGDFALSGGQRCYPLTLSDNYSRYLLACRALTRTTHAAVAPWFEWVFREHGLPDAIRTDNGAPFGSLALGGITPLSVWWIRLGIRPQRIRPGRPSQNGRHERMHRSLNAEGVAPIQASLTAQQRQFDTFITQYNRERSHEALERQTPESLYRRSPRTYPAKLPAVAYDTGVTVRRVRRNGEIKWRGRLLYVSAVLAGEPVALTPIDERHWELRYSFHRLGRVDEHTGTITPVRTWHGAD